MTAEMAESGGQRITRMQRFVSRGDAPILPKSSIASRALVAVVAIMTFLAALTTGAVMLVRAAASAWEADVMREVTIQIRPVDGRDIEDEVKRAVALARVFPGLAEVRPYSKEESARLLEPWLGAGARLDDLPVPRLIVVRVAPGAAPDFAQLRQSLSEQVAGASLDDHRAWTDRIAAMAGIAVFGGGLVLWLMLAATVLSVMFATRGAMAINRPIVEVLHFTGATDGFIANEFQRHFLVLGLQGGAIGGGAAMALFALMGLALDGLFGGAARDQFGLLFGRHSIGILGYAAVVVEIALIALVTAATSRYTVNRILQTIE
jgi:cell division transport system permease protein